MSYKAGLAKRVINPDGGVELWGYVERSGICSGVLDDIFAKVLVVADEQKRVAIITLDLGGVSGEIADRIKKAIEAATHIPALNITISTTHTHSAPAALKLRNAGAINAGFIAKLRGQIVEAAVEAVNNLEPVSIGYGQDSAEMSVNRRECGVESDINRDSGTVDPMVRVIRIDSKDGNPLALVVNYAAHPVTLRADNLSVSADYPGQIALTVEQMLNCETLFLQGPCADIIVKVFGDAEAMKTVGQHLGEKAVEIACLIETEAGADLNWFSKSVKLGYEKAPTRQWLEDFVEGIVNKGEYKNDVWAKNDLDWASELLRAYEGGPKIPCEIACPVDVLRLGEAVFIFLPGEIFLQTGLEIRSRIVSDKVFITANSNEGSIGYLLTKDMLRESGYEVESAYRFYGHCKVQGDAEQRIVESVIELLAEAGVCLRS
jgi:hypothetical protein